MAKTLVLIWGLVTSGLTLVQGANETLAATVSTQSMYSPGWLANENYTSNLLYTYYVNTAYPNHTVRLQVIDCQMEHDKNDNCLYDKLEIFDGPDENSTSISEFCCASTSSSFQSTGSEIFVKFTTDNTSNYRGFNIGYTSDGITTTTTTTSTTTTTPASTVPVPQGSSSGGGNDNTLYIIIGTVIGVLLLLILIIILVCCMMKMKSRPLSRDSARDTKRVLFTRSSTMVQPIDRKEALPPGTVTQTNIFDMELPETGRGNQLPPLSAKMPRLMNENSIAVP